MQATIKPARTNHNTGLLGIIAVVCMLFDHAGAAFFRDVVWLRVVGRIAFPLFAWGIAIGAEHTRSIARYALRLLLLALISQPFYMLGLNHTITQLSIFPTLLLGLLGIWGLRDRQEWLTVVAVLLAAVLDIDYGVRGVMCILMLWALRDNPLALAICFSAYCATVWGYGRAVLTTRYFSIPLQTCAILALPLMLWPMSTRTRTPRWLMYAVYPAHLAVIWVIKLILQ